MSTIFSDKAQKNPLFTTFPVAIFLHGVLIFATGFMTPEPNAVRKSTLLDITLVNSYSDVTPKDADFIAESNQQGSGSLDAKKKITSRSASETPNDDNGDKTFSSEEAAPSVVPKPKPQVLTTKGKTSKTVKKEVQEEEVKETRVVKTEVSEKAEKIAMLMAEMNKEEQKYARRPRIHFVDSISAKSAVEARYIKDWARKLERIGNINFPDEAIRLSLSGTLILNATLDRAGRVVEMQIDVSSGSRVLDKAALQIVKLAAPYEPLPSEIRKKYDRLNITRSIVFHKENGRAAFYTN